VFVIGTRQTAVAGVAANTEVLAEGADGAVVIAGECIVAWRPWESLAAVRQRATRPAALKPASTVGTPAGKRALTASNLTGTSASSSQAPAIRGLTGSSNRSRRESILWRTGVGWAFADVRLLAG